MKILVIGFQRSGTTLLRRMIQAHPDVRKIFHETFFVSKLKTKKNMEDTISFDIDALNWGEKIPYYSKVRRDMTATEYCNRWFRLFGKEARVVHIIRHPIDVALSTQKKIGLKDINRPLSFYRKSVRKTTEEITGRKYVLNVKYEELLQYPQEVMERIFEFCGLRTDVNIESRMTRTKKAKYKKIDPSRAFVYLKRTLPMITIDLAKDMTIINKLTQGPKYKWIKQK